MTIDNKSGCPPSTKKCTLCGKRKKLTAFHRKRRGRTSRCAACRNKKSKFYFKQSAGGFEKREPAFEYDYRCQACGMGHRNQQKADDCCVAKRESIYSPQEITKGKYDGYAGDQEWKYTRTRRLSGGLGKLGEG